MCGTILWVGKQDDSITLQSVNSMHWWPSFQRRRIEIRGRIVKTMLSNCPKMFILGTYWTTWYSFVGEQTCTIDHKMDQSVRQTIISFYLLHSSYMWLQTILSCGKHGKTMHIGTVSRLRFCRRSWGFKVYIRWNIVHLRKPYVCSNQFGCVRNKLQFRTVQQNQKSCPWIQDEGWTVYPRLIYGIWSSQFFKETRIRMIKYGETRVNLQHERKFMERLMIWTMFILFPQTYILLVRKLCCMCLKTTKQWSIWS